MAPYVSQLSACRHVLRPGRSPLCARTGVGRLCFGRAASHVTKPCPSWRLASNCSCCRGLNVYSKPGRSSSVPRGRGSTALGARPRRTGPSAERPCARPVDDDDDTTRRLLSDYSRRRVDRLRGSMDYWKQVIFGSTKAGALSRSVFPSFVCPCLCDVTTACANRELENQWRS